jgi:Highly conserved protein containing a thioredoxin domain
MKNKAITLLLTTLVFNFLSCKKTSPKLDIDKQINYCAAQALQTLSTISSPESIPNNIDKDSINWNYTKPGSWTSGFWPGILWYLYEGTGDESWKKAAKATTATIIPMTQKKAHSHDSGFITMTSLGNGYRLTGNEIYKTALLSASDYLTELYNPVVGSILSWPGMVARQNWPHNTIIDNMMNLELLLWAARNGDNKAAYDIAVSHAEKTMRYGFREDYTNYHVAVYDTITGNFIKGVTHQGFSDDSMWARGQAWAIYGYTLMYRETKDQKFLDFARKVAEVYLSRLPQDMIPYWDFKAARLNPDEPRDASAAAVTASALLELSTFVSGEEAEYYKETAISILTELSTPEYQSRDKNNAFLLHSVGHMPRGSEIDSSIIYADYYYLEALIRAKKMGI